MTAALYRLSRIDRSRNDNATTEHWDKAHHVFHFALISASNMPLLLNFVAVLHGLSDRYRRLFLATNPPDRNAAREHERIAEAAVAR